MEVLVIVLVVVAVVLLTVVGLVARTGRRRRLRPPPRPAVDYRPGVGDDAEVPRDTSKPTVATIELPEAPPQPRPPAEAPPAPVPEEPPALDQIAPTAGRLVRLRARLSRSQNVFGRGLLAVLARDHLDDEDWEEIEDTLLTADLGVAPTQELIESLRTKVKVLGARTPEHLRTLLRDELLAQVGTATDRTLATHHARDKTAVVLVVGVNGTGKTTTCGKLARVFIADGRSVLLGAADTFRAAAADQLQTWGARVGADTVRGPEGGDPAAVAFDAVKRGIADGVDVVLVDTAGRLHTKTGLMDELGKVKRVVEKHGPVDEARVFTEVVDVTGIVLTKLDGTAKGGIVIAVQRELGVPVKLVGLGEGPDDLAPFEPEAFVDALLGAEQAA
jgi:fused signal recognition particle receptor